MNEPNYPTTYSYDPNGYISRKADETGICTTYSYGRVPEVIIHVDSQSLLTTMTWEEEK